MAVACPMKKRLVNSKLICFPIPVLSGVLVAIYVRIPCTPYISSLVLYQNEKAPQPLKLRGFLVVRPTGFEPATFRVGVD